MVCLTSWSVVGTPQDGAPMLESGDLKIRGDGTAITFISDININGTCPEKAAEHNSGTKKVNTPRIVYGNIVS